MNCLLRGITNTAFLVCWFSLASAGQGTPGTAPGYGNNPAGQAGPDYQGSPAYRDLTHYSKVFGHPKFYRIYLPKGYDAAGRRYPVIYFFHGWGGRHFKDDNARLEYVQLKGLVDKYQVILVMWDGNVDLAEPRPYNVGNHEDVKFQVQMKDYFPELTGYIDSAYRTLTDRGHRGIIGFSMGGFMSLFLAGKYPDKVCAAVSMAGSPEFFVGYPGNQTLYPVRYTFTNLRQVDTRMHNGTSDILYYLNGEVHAGALWDEQVRLQYWTFPGGHMVDLPGQTRVFEKAMAFITEAFKKPALPLPVNWSHYDLYPDFDVWNYKVESDKQEPGFLFLKNVDKKGFGWYSGRWLPDGPSLQGLHAQITTAPVYLPGKDYGLVRYSRATDHVTRDQVTADAEGRVKVAMDGDGEAGIFDSKDAPEWVYLDYMTGRYLNPGRKNQLTLRLFNRGGENQGSGMIRVEISTKDPSVRWTDSVVEIRVGPGQRIVDLPPFTLSCTKRPPPHAEPADIRFHLAVRAAANVYKDEFTAPVFFQAPAFDSVRVDDGLRLRDTAMGTGNGNGVADAGERIMLYQGSHRLRLYTQDPWIIGAKERLADEDLPARWPDGFTLSSVVQVSPDCPDGHQIVFLANYETKTFNPIERKVTWGRVTVTVRHSPRVLMDEFFGVNIGNCSASSRDIKKVAGWVRDYSNWPWLEPEKNQFRFTNALGRMNYDSFYRALDTQGIKSLFVVQQTPKWVSGRKTGIDPAGFAPSAGQDGLHPDQYTDAASFFYQLAARYGSRKADPGNLLTKDKLSGLHLMNAIEVYNEPDGTWGDHMTLEQYAALLNAAYDGNNHRMKGQYGIKAADPDILVSIGGLADNLGSLKKIVAYAGRAPFDVINAHYYTFRQVRENYRVSVAPEWSSLEADMKDMVAWGREHAPGRPVWMTEIGWDTKDHNPEYVTEQEAANYLIRSYLLALGAGVEKCFWFIYSDIDDSGPAIVFSSSGLFQSESTPYDGPTRLKPKLTYWYDASFKQLASGYYFDSNQSFPKGDSTIYDYRFSDADGKKRLAILWYCPKYQYAFRPLESRPSKVVYSYILPDSTWKITKVVRPAAGTLEGEPQSYKKSAGGISLHLDATPVFIEMEQTGN
jgi:enterochelin esterase-like enzyme